MKEIKLDIGCGRQLKEGWIGLDIQKFPGTEVYDMRKDQLPFNDGEVDAIRCINTLEHISREHYLFVFNEWYRALKVGGTVEFIVPNLEKNIAHAWGDITHLSPWVHATVKYLSGERPRHASYGFLPWEIVKCEDLKEEPRDLHVIMKTRLDKKTGKKYA